MDLIPTPYIAGESLISSSVNITQLVFKMKLSGFSPRPSLSPATCLLAYKRRANHTLPSRLNMNRNGSRNRLSVIAPAPLSLPTCRLGKKWMEYQGLNNWDGLLDPLDDNLRAEIIRYGKFVEASYCAFDFDPTSPTYATSKFPRNSFLTCCGLEHSGYRMTKNLRATCGIKLPPWVDRGTRWASTTSSWIGFVAVSEDKEEISRLGRRDVVISYRGTATCMEWLENLRSSLTAIPSNMTRGRPLEHAAHPMVQSGFLSLYNSRTGLFPSLREMIREEVLRLGRRFGDVPLSFTITGHSLGAALATLTAYDIQSILPEGTMVTVVSFGGPRVGNRIFRNQLEKHGTRILRIVNSDDLITKLPGFIREKDEREQHWRPPGLLEKMRWDYADVGRELRLSSRESPYFKKANVATCHELSTYLHLVNEFVSTACPFKGAARKMLRKRQAQKMQKVGLVETGHAM